MPNAGANKSHKLLPDDALQVLWDKHNQGIGRAGVLAIIVSALGLSTTGTGAWLIAKYATFDASVAAAKKEIEAGIGLVPVGTVVAWPGDLPPPDSAWHEQWHVCDGHEVPVSGKDQLWLALRRYPGNDATAYPIPKMAKLPDFQGYFLRGCKVGTGLGGKQPWTTGLPVAATTFLKRATEKKEYVEGLYFGTEVRNVSIVDPVDGAGPNTNGQRTTMFVNTDSANSVGRPRQDLLFDDETSPSHYAVHWIIRVK